MVRPPIDAAQSSGSDLPIRIVPAATVRELPPGSAVVIESVDGQPIDAPFTARIVTKHGQLICPPGITVQFTQPRDGEMYRVLWVTGESDDYAADEVR